MGKATPKGVLLQHAQNYVRAVMADRLREEGFVSKDGEDVYWYRVVNGDVIHSVSFITRHTSIPMWMQIGIGFHPLFITPEFPNSPYIYAMPASEVMSDGNYIVKESNNAVFSENAKTICPHDALHGRDILEGAMSVFEMAQTPRQCYEIHKERKRDALECGSLLTMSSAFVDEVIYWDDQELYPFCGRYIEKEITVCEDLLSKGRKLPRSYVRNYQNLLAAKPAIFESRREDYLEVLYSRIPETIRRLKKHTGIEL
jgi:hypothetical protein